MDEVLEKRIPSPDYYLHCFVAPLSLWQRSGWRRSPARNPEDETCEAGKIAVVPAASGVPIKPAAVAIIRENDAVVCGTP